MLPICCICKSSQTTRSFDSQINLYRCAQCDHTFTVIDDSYKEKNIYAQEYFDEFHKNWFKHPNIGLFRYIHQTVLSKLKKHDFKLIDIGSGRGDLLNYLRKQEKASDLYGLDIAPCQAKSFKFIQEDFMQSKLKEKFDAVTSLAFIEHVEDPDLFVKKLKDIVSVDGLIIIMTINAGGMMYGLATLLNKIGFHSAYRRLYSEHHIHHFNNKSLRLLLEKNSLRIVSQTNHNYSLASVDYPSAGPLMTMIYKTITAVIFGLSSMLKNGISQTLVAVPEKI